MHSQKKTSMMSIFGVAGLSSNIKTADGEYIPLSSFASFSSFDDSGLKMERLLQLLNKIPSKRSVKAFDDFVIIYDEDINNIVSIWNSKGELLFDKNTNYGNLNGTLLGILNAIFEGLPPEIIDRLKQKLAKYKEGFADISRYKEDEISLEDIPTAEPDDISRIYFQCLREISSELSDKRKKLPDAIPLSEIQSIKSLEISEKFLSRLQNYYMILERNLEIDELNIGLKNSLKTTLGVEMGTPQASL